MTVDATPYDQIRYPGQAYRQAHPDRLAALATLLGLQPAPTDRCRVLELGCGTGSNLIPMAWSLPESQFVGIDLAARPIAEGQAAIETIGLTNIRLAAMDLMDFAESMGPFDYIIAHGLYSWVPATVRQRIMALCRSHLAEHGVAFISYNAYPGCHLRDMVREMLLYHVHNAPDPQTRIRQGQALLQFLAQGQDEPDEYGGLLAKELQRVMHYATGHFYHDDLAEINQPFYFHQFIEQAEAAGLQFLSEAEYFMIRTDSFPEPTARVLDSLGANILIQQQYLDFLRCRRFRQTLLCRKERTVNHQVEARRMADFAFSSPGRTETAELDFSPDREIEFQGEQGSRLRTTDPLAKAALACLEARWPQAVPFPELLNQALDRLGRQPTATDVDDLGAILQQCFGSGVVELHLRPPQLVLEPGPRPLASPCARLQAAAGDLITTLRHRTVCLADIPARQLLELLDGTRTVAELVVDLGRKIREQAAAPAEPSGPNPESEVDEQQVRIMLADFARLGLLIR